VQLIGWFGWQDLIRRLLVQNPDKRLGTLAGGASDIKRHSFFRGLDWDALIRRRATNPFAAPSACHAVLMSCIAQC
jgi:hypothetical protein